MGPVGPHIFLCWPGSASLHRKRRWVWRSGSWPEFRLLDSGQPERGESDQACQIVLPRLLATNRPSSPQDDWRPAAPRESGSPRATAKRQDGYGRRSRGMLRPLQRPRTPVHMDPAGFKEMHIDTSGELSGVGNFQLESSRQETKGSLMVVSADPLVPPPSPGKGSSRRT